MDNPKILIDNLNNIHTTKMGVDRIKKNLKLDTDDVVKVCKDIITNTNSKIIRKGKNWYITNINIIITVNAYSYTIITAHIIKQ